MKKNTEVTVPAQKHFSVGNWSFLKLSVSPTLYLREGANEPFEYVKETEFSFGGGKFSTNVHTNEYGQLYSYATASHELVFKNASTEYRFNAIKFGNQVTYSTRSPRAAVETYPWIFDDFIGSIGLVVNTPDTPANDKVDRRYIGCDFQINDQVVQYSPDTPVHPAPQTKVSKVVFPDTGKFSLLANVNVYFSGCDVYREVSPGQIYKVERHGEGNPRVDTDFYLTPDKSYPAGITTLVIKDGFSDATAVIEFDHNTVEKQVTMTIKSFTSTLCDIRDFVYLEIHFPNAICIAL
ncbi:hypothetical protein CD58_11160 [Pseudomonas brassicacearum]|uniref:hypothetical protein n=1 Tax=Pseudomonas brassicacearum TaxID=930166 RepID=UPI00042F4E2A|nr:hypothetical protein [Pseudomonas brassicacearum]AHL36857.1 hypothetical protein CD58_11160 [Pseudomonas brassicacearum]